MKARKETLSSRTIWLRLLLMALLLAWIVSQWALWNAAHELHEDNEGSSPRYPKRDPGEDDQTHHPTSKTMSSADDDDFFIVFSTDCSGYQHWQGILLYYSALRVQQQGTIVRIASGCSMEQQTAVKDEWRKIDPTGRKFHVHFAPSTALNTTYKYSNKPGGLLHWLKHTQNLHEETVVCLLDPDMILLKAITADLVSPHWSIRPHPKGQVEFVNEQGNAELIRVQSLPNPDKLPTRVTTGHAAGQHFGIGGSWSQGMRPNAKPVWRNFSKAFVCGDGGACTKTSSTDASQLYGVGPVYLATVHDWHMIAATWWEFVPRVHQQYSHLLAEMYALTMAVADLQIPFALFSSYMVTGADISSPTEAWSWVDDIVTDPNNPLPQACPGVGTEQPPRMDPSLPLPRTLHHCQRYKLDLKDSFLFAKRRIPHDVFSCSSEKPVPFDVQDLIQQASQKSTPWTTAERRSLFALCHAASIMNWARREYRKQVCE